VARAEAAEDSLQNAIDAEAAARAADIATASAALAAEQSRALSAEASLSARISDIENGIDLGTFGGGGQAHQF
jgi:hypothetical protein